MFQISRVYHTIIALRIYHISSAIRQSSVLLPKQSQKSRSILKDGSRPLGMFKKGKICITAKFHRTDLVICSYSRERKTPPYSQINIIGQNVHANSFDNI